MTQSEEAGPVRHDPYAALQFPDFRRLLASSFLSTLGDQMASVAVGWQLYERTHTPFSLGLVGLVEVLPVILLSLPGGYVADRGNRKNIAVGMRFVLALCFGGMALVSRQNAPVGWLYVCLFFIGVARAFSGPASSTLMPQVVPGEVFTNAVTWGSNAWQLASAIGPALGGLTIALTNSATPAYMAAMMGALTYAVLVASIRGNPGVARQEAQKRETPSLQSLVAGIEFLRRTPVLMAAITLDLFAVLFGGATALLPVYAKDILHVGPTGLGWLRAMPSIGAVSMALFVAHRPPFKRAGKAFLWAVAGFGIATIVFGVSHWFWLSLIMLFVLGALDNISVVVRSALLLLRAPDEMRGRVSAVNSIFVSTSNELGAFESGTVAGWLGPVFAVVSGGIGTLLVVLGVACVWPQLRELGELHETVAEG